MQPSKKLIILVTDSAATFSAEEFNRLYNSTAGTVDHRITIAPLLESIVSRPEKREKKYWVTKYERWRK